MRRIWPEVPGSEDGDRPGGKSSQWPKAAKGMKWDLLQHFWKECNQLIYSGVSPVIMLDYLSVEL